MKAVLVLIPFFFCLETFAKLPSQLLQVSHHDNLNSFVLVVDKTERQLYVYKQRNGVIELDQSFPVDIGKGVGKKEKRGDLKTPEGIYFLIGTKTQPEIPFSLYGKLAFVSDFPNPFDKLEQKTGDGIWLHGVPDEVSLERGSRGCVVVRNATLDYLKMLVNAGTTAMIIRDKIEWVEDVNQQEKAKVIGLISEWVKAWQNKSEEYFGFYSNVFASTQFKNFGKLVRHKKNVFQFNEKIDIKFDPLLIIKESDQIVVTGIQIYNGTTLSDRGIKRVYMRNESGAPKIISEEWLSTSYSPSVLEALVNGSVAASSRN